MKNISKLSTDPKQSASEQKGSLFFEFFRKNLNEISLVIGVFVVGALFTSQTNSFLTSSNIINILRSAAYLGIVTWGMTLVILAGEIDLSVGPAVACSAVLIGWFTSRNNIPLATSILLVFAFTTLVCYGGGYIRARFNLPSFVTTMALSSIFDGLKQVLSDNMPIPVKLGDLRIIATGNLWTIPYPVIIAIVLFFIFRHIAKNTVYGRSIYAVGGNAKAAYASGINVNLIRSSIFAINGFLAALTGLLQVLRLGTSTGAVGDGLEFSAIAAVVIGGTALSGGRGNMVGSLIGLVFTSVISNGLVLMGVDSQAQNIFRGFLILFAVLMNVIFKKESKNI
jgi:ribose/xylose/arabinose/galactoside ABC-type transport system permease subunit